MILRVYRVRVVPELREEFEQQFVTVRDEFIAGRDGLVSVEIAKPTEHAPDEYMMITRWRDLEAVQRFAGNTWMEPVIPQHMRKYMQESCLHHYELL